MLGGITMNFYNFYTGQIFDAYNYLGAHIEKKVLLSVHLHLLQVMLR